MKVLYNEQTVSTSGDRYMDLAGLPMINSVPLIGNKTSSELNMYTKNEIDNMVSSMQAVQVVEILPALPDPCTLYYVGTEAPYQVVFFDKNRVRHDMGESSVDLSVFQKIVDAALKTTAKNVVGAINEIDTGVGNVSTLQTTQKTVVPAINEVYTQQGDVANLTTTNKTNLVSAANELDKEVGNLANLKTPVKTNLVDSINSLKKENNLAFVYSDNYATGFLGALDEAIENYKKNIMTYIYETHVIYTPMEFKVEFDSAGNLTNHKITYFAIKSKADTSTTPIKYYPRFECVILEGTSRTSHTYKSYWYDFK